ncbi:hypothetical protein FPV67DRAFT_1625517 [Lyophyllum atratum]|nr:hypothetical protein FPV67DRAFT_1625517 [Lyophyllum atratum]
MVMGFFQHIYRYFVPDKPHESVSGATGHQLQDNPLPPADLTAFLQNSVPLYDSNGQIIAYVPRQGNFSQLQAPKKEIKSQTNVTLAAPTITKSESRPPAKISGCPTPAEAHHQRTSSKTPTVTDWDGWPDGFFERDFTFNEVFETNNLKAHWAMKVSGGDRKGDSHAMDWQGGKKSTRRCMGIMECDDRDCEVVTRPQTTPQGIASQLRGPCACGARLLHQPCNIRSELWTFSGGIHYSNGGFHLHQGPGDSVADISDVLLNADRVSKERQKIKKGTEVGGDGFIAAFSSFVSQHPHFVINSVLSDVTVVSVQTPFMRSQLVKEKLLEGPINGTVNDAAHGWWKERNSLLMITSTYCPNLFCWVPGVMSYTNGASAEHFKYHFDAVLQSIAHEAEAQKIMVTDRLFAGVMDFSQAEYAGFVAAFVDFWRSHPNDSRSEKQLKAAAEAPRGWRV